MNIETLQQALDADRYTLEANPVRGQFTLHSALLLTGYLRYNYRIFIFPTENLIPDIITDDLAYAKKITSKLHRKSYHGIIYHEVNRKEWWGWSFLNAVKVWTF